MLILRIYVYMKKKHMSMYDILLGIGFSVCVVFCAMFGRLIYSCWILPNILYTKLKRAGLTGPSPTFPMGNLTQMRIKNKMMMIHNIHTHPHDIHSTVFPYFSTWQKSFGKVFMYWLGTEPFAYIADPEFLKKMSAGILGKSWGKPTVFKNDRKPMFGNGLIMVEGDDWVRHRHVITPAFSNSNLKAMASLMVESTTSMLDRWTNHVNTGSREIDVEKEITMTAGEIIAKTSFGISCGNGRKVFEKLRAMQLTLFKSNRLVGVPFSKFMCQKQTQEAKRLGKEIDALFLSIITNAKKNADFAQQNLLGVLLSHNHSRDGTSLSTSELIDECKTFFFGGHETTALVLTWTLMLLSMHQEWQNQLREEIKQVIGDEEIDATMLVGLKKMGWVMSEVLRLYPTAPNVQRQARVDMKVNDDITIPSGTNMWIDVVAMHHDPNLWGDNVNEFKPERFKNDPVHGGCKHKMGYLPFGFGGRMCVGKNLSMMEYKIVLTLILKKFSLTLSPNYSHSPGVLLSLRPTQGLQLLLQPL